MDRSSPQLKTAKQRSNLLSSLPGLLKVKHSPSQDRPPEHNILEATTDQQDNAEFHHIFNLPDNEKLITSKSANACNVVVYRCAMRRGIIITGKMYISQNYVCFYAHYLTMIRKVRL